MLEPAIDTLLVCSLTAFALLITGVWTDSTLDGVTMTAVAFEQGIPGIGSYLLILCVFFFSITTMFTYSYYGTKRSEEHTSELQSRGHLVCRLLLEKKNADS